MRPCFAFLFSFLLLASPARAQLAPSIDSLARAFKAEHDVPGLIIGTTGPNGQHVQAYGVAVREDNVRLGSDTRFEIGSVTKVFTALLLADAAARNELALGDALGTLLPDSVRAPTYEGQPIRLHHLATHTSGLPRLPSNMGPQVFTPDPYVDYGADSLYAFLGGYDLTRPPGARYAYSNLSAGLLGHVLARCADTSYAALLRERVLAPLGLADTYVPASADTATAGPRLARGYRSDGEATSYWHFDALAGAGALRSTPADVLRFLEAQMHPPGSLADAIATMQTQRHELNPRMSVALGWHVLSMDEIEEPFYWHNGGTGGFKSFAGFWADTRRGLVVLSNRVTPGQSLDRLAVAVARRLHPE